MEGFPCLPAFRLRRAKPSFAIATSMFHDGNGGQNRRLEIFLNNARRGAPDVVPGFCHDEASTRWVKKEVVAVDVAVDVVVAVAE